MGLAQFGFDQVAILGRIGLSSSQTLNNFRLVFVRVTQLDGLCLEETIFPTEGDSFTFYFLSSFN